MKIATQSRPEFTHIAKLIEGIPIAMLTTMQADDAMASRPMAALEMDEQGALWFLTDQRSSKVECLDVANLCFVDTAHGAYVSLSGHIEVTTDREGIKRLWTPLAKPWFSEGPDSNNLALLKFVPDAADYWDGHGSHTGLSTPAPAPISALSP